MKYVKCVVVGDGAVGKTCLQLSYTTDAFPSEYIPTVFDSSSPRITVEDQEISLQLWDTFGQEDYKKLRALSYPYTDVFVICFSLVDPESLENVRKTWIPEVKEHCPTTPYILVGTKLDLREKFAQCADEYRRNGWERVSSSMAEEMAETIKAQAYVQCSAKILYNVKEVFETAVKVVLHSPAAQQTSSRGGNCGCDVA
jgi:small GTP-binding protein